MTSTDVVDSNTLVFNDSLQCCYVSTSKVNYVDVVANTCTIVSIIIITEYTEFSTLTYGSLSDVRHQVVRNTIRVFLKKGILRHVNDLSFAEDPLRVLRAAQFAARFEFRVAPETIELCRGMELMHLPRERVEGELKKALLKAEKPSIFFEVLRQMEQLDIWFPELMALIGIPQNPTYHAEGDVWNHTMQVLDEGAKLRHRPAQPLWFMLSCLTHDFGKAVCTEEVNGILHAYEHEVKGLPLAETFLNRLTSETKLTEYVLNLTELHMKPNTVAGARSSIKTTNRMFDQAIDPEGLLCIALADDRGRISTVHRGDNEVLLRDRLAIFKEIMARPHVMGRDLMEAGLTPGADFSEILSYAHKLRLAGVEKGSALKQTLAYARQLRS